jgi:uncharacterized phiE125 gp8 family phage protein
MVDSYLVVTPPVELAVSLALVKEHLKLDLSDTSQDTYLTLLIRAVTSTIEKYTGRTLINTEFKTYRECFTNSFLVKRSKLQSITFIKYYTDSVLTEVDSDIYYISDETNFASVFLVDGESWPSDVDDRVQPIVIQFIAGYGDTQADIPYDLQIVLLDAIAYFYENRGDCSDGCSLIDATFLPKGIQQALHFFKIMQSDKKQYGCL